MAVSVPYLSSRYLVTSTAVKPLATHNVLYVWARCFRHCRHPAGVSRAWFRAEPPGFGTLLAAVAVPPRAGNLRFKDCGAQWFATRPAPVSLVYHRFALSDAPPSTPLPCGASRYRKQVAYRLQVGTDRPKRRELARKCDAGVVPHCGIMAHSERCH